MAFAHDTLSDHGIGGLSANAETRARSTVDRHIVGEIIQRVPADHYTLTLRSHDLGGGRWRPCIIGDLTGTRVLEAIDDGAMCLCLRDIGGLLRERLGPLGFDFPATTASGEPLSHGLVIASRDLALTLSDVVGSGMMHGLEGNIHLVFAEGAIRSDQASPEWSVNIAQGQDFSWFSTRPRRFETGGGLVIALTRAVVPPTTDLSPWRLDLVLDHAARRLRTLHRRIFGAPERWATATLGNGPVGGAPVVDSGRTSSLIYRLVRRPSRHSLLG